MPSCDPPVPNPKPRMNTLRLTTDSVAKPVTMMQTLPHSSITAITRSIP